MPINNFSFSAQQARNAAKSTTPEVKMLAQVVADLVTEVEELKKEIAKLKSRS